MKKKRCYCFDSQSFTDAVRRRQRRFLAQDIPDEPHSRNAASLLC